jgi:hypothetical protein
MARDNRGWPGRNETPDLATPPGVSLVAGRYSQVRLSVWSHSPRFT